MATFQDDHGHIRTIKTVVGVDGAETTVEPEGNLPPSQSSRRETKLNAVLDTTTGAFVRYV